MRRPTRTIETDVCVVGAGLTGLAHAYEARRRGLSVVVLERDPRAVGGSVRHSGHLFFSSLSAAALLSGGELSRRRWLELGRRAGFSAQDAGTLVIARHRDELAVLEAAAGEPERRARMLTRSEIHALVPIPTEGVLGAFHAPRDLLIDTRMASARLANALTRDPQARVEWNTHVHEVLPGEVRADPLRVRAQAVVVCPGAAANSLPPQLRPRGGALTFCQLQMLRLAAPPGRRYRPALTTVASVLEHAAFAEQEGVEQLRARFELERPELIERNVHPLVAQLPDGDLVVGDTRTYANPALPFASERVEQLLLGEVRALLGVATDVRQRWQAVRPHSRSAAEDGFLVSAPVPGVRVVQSVSSLGTALCHARARAVLDELLTPPSVGWADSAADLYAGVRDDMEGQDMGVRSRPEAFARRPLARR